MNYSEEKEVRDISPADQNLKWQEYWVWNTGLTQLALTMEADMDILQQYCLWDFTNLRAANFLIQNNKSKITSEESKDGTYTSLEVLKDTQYSLRYDPVGTNTRTRRVIICGSHGCGKEFIKAWNFLDHYRMHVGIRPFVCHICGKSFTQKGNLKKHRRQHEQTNVKDRKVHKCHLWDKSYTERYNLRVSWHYSYKFWTCVN